MIAEDQRQHMTESIICALRLELNGCQLAVLLHRPRLALGIKPVSRSRHYLQLGGRYSPLIRVLLRRVFVKYALGRQGTSIWG